MALNLYWQNKQNFSVFSNNTIVVEVKTNLLGFLAKERVNLAVFDFCGFFVKLPCFGADTSEGDPKMSFNLTKSLNFLT